MNKRLESLERLAMPDDVHIKECTRLGISNKYDYELIKKELTKIDKIENIINSFKTSEKTDYICRLYLQSIIEVIQDEL